MDHPPHPNALLFEKQDTSGRQAGCRWSSFVQVLQLSEPQLPHRTAGIVMVLSNNTGEYLVIV